MVSTLISPNRRPLRLAIGSCLTLGGIVLVMLASRQPIPRQQVHPSTERRTVLGVSVTEPVLKAQRPGGSGMVSVAIEVANRESTVVELGDARTSCGCTTMEPLTEKRLAPGATRVLRFSANRPKFGEQLVTVDVPLRRGNAEAIMPIVFRLTGEPAPTRQIYSMPRELELRGLPGETVQRRLFIDAIEPPEEPPWITGWEANHSELSAETVTALRGHAVGTAAKRHYEVLITAKIPSGGERESCRLMPTFPEGGEEVKPIMVDLSPLRWRPYPPTVQLRSETRIRIVPDDPELPHDQSEWRIVTPASLQAEFLSSIVENKHDIVIRPVVNHPLTEPALLRIVDQTDLEVCRVVVLPRKLPIAPD